MVVYGIIRYGVEMRKYEVLGFRWQIQFGFTLLCQVIDLVVLIW